MLGGRYHLVEPLARGGMAAVWIADDPVLSRRVAVKILRDDLAADSATRARFRHEAIAAARLNHPNVVATYDTGDDDGTAYIVMELINGPTVRELLREQGRLPVREALRIGMQVADALEAAHRAGIVHRDVKPPNVLVPPAGPVKVTDFGIAKATGADDLTRTGTVMGTARYLAPEQVNGKPTDARTDVYALGLLLYEMLCGTPPFGGDTDVATAMARLTTTAPSIRAQRPTVPQSLDDVVHRCLARDPARRFPSAADVRAALAAVRPDPKAAARPAPRPAPRPPKARTAVRSGTQPVRKRRSSGVTWFWVVIVFMLAIAAGVAAFLVLRDDIRHELELVGAVDRDARLHRGEACVTTTPTSPRASRGDRRALETLLDRHADRVHALCRRVLTHPEDALDATQEAMIAIARGIARFDGRSAFTTWLYRVATNAALDELRRKQRRPDPFDGSTVEQAAPGPALDTSVSARVDVDAALDTIPSEFRVAVVLRDLCDLDYAEISEVLGIPPGTVRSRISRGRALLATALGNPEDPSGRLSSDD